MSVATTCPESSCWVCLATDESNTFPPPSGDHPQRGSPGLCPTGVTGDHPTPILPRGMELEQRTKLFPHSGHSQGFSPLWMRQWMTRSDLRTKLFLQSGHLKGRSPVCRRWWVRRWELRMKLQPSGFSPVWILWWRVRCCLCLKLFPHSKHS
uniref:Uncharacterized protein n=1 Tax=Corvus moneduloides TaxID=1196302 RepID=A0A8U7NP14_CORMO